MTERATKKVQFPHLDAFRSLAFLSVFFSHSFHSDVASVRAHPGYLLADGLTSLGYLGVNFFFVLSGFLITYLLLEERAHTGRIHVGAFYARRVLRIWPLYFAVVAVGFIAFPILKAMTGGVPDEPASPWMYVLFLANYDVIRVLPDASILGVLWSVSVEEQFYLAWPVLVMVLSAKNLPRALVFLCALSLVYRLTVVGDAARSTFATPSCIVDLSMGALAACALYERWPIVVALTAVRRRWIVLAYAVGLAGLVSLSYTGGTLLGSLIERPFLSVLFAFVILEQVSAEHSFFKMGSLTLLGRMGTYTYGLYCLHFVGILIATQITLRLGWDQYWWQEVFVETSLALGITLVVAVSSYHLLEKPFLKLKSRFAFIQR